jgi:hypothetical protein
MAPSVGYYQNVAPEKFFFGTSARLGWLVGRVS